MSKCKCTMSISVLGDGCRYCQPQEYIDRLHESAELDREELAAVEQEFEALKAAMGEPVGDLTISDDDFDMGLTDDYAFGKKRLANGGYNLYAIKAKP